MASLRLRNEAMRREQGGFQQLHLFIFVNSSNAAGDLFQSPAARCRHYLTEKPEGSFRLKHGM